MNAQLGYGAVGAPRTRVPTHFVLVLDSSTTIMHVARRLVWLLDHPAVGVYGTPVILAAGIYFSVAGPDWWDDFFTAHALGFLISFWIGSGFSLMWWTLRRQAGQLPSGEATTAVIGVTGLLLVGGLSLLADPAYLGVTIWPGLGLLRSALEKAASPPPGEPDP